MTEREVTWTGSAGGLKGLNLCIGEVARSHWATDLRGQELRVIQNNLVFKRVQNNDYLVICQ